MAFQRYFNQETNTIEIIRNDFNPNQFKIARWSRGMTFKALAEELQVSPRLVSEVEKGKKMPDEDFLSRLEFVLGFPRKFFFDWEHKPISEKNFHFCKIDYNDPPEYPKKGKRK